MKMLPAAVLVVVWVHSAGACSLFEGIYKGSGDNRATAFPHDFGFGMKLDPGGRIFTPNGRGSLVLEPDASDSFEQPDIPDVGFERPDLPGINTDNPPAAIVIKGETYRFHCPTE